MIDSFFSELYNSKHQGNEATEINLSFCGFFIFKTKTSLFFTGISFPWHFEQRRLFFIYFTGGKYDGKCT